MGERASLDTTGAKWPFIQIGERLMARCVVLSMPRKNLSPGRISPSLVNIIFTHIEPTFPLQKSAARRRQAQGGSFSIGACP